MAERNNSEFYDIDAFHDAGANYSDPNIHNVVDIVYPPMLIIIGVTCNIIVICVMRTPCFYRQPISVFMIAGSVNDVLSLLISMPTHWLYVAFDNIYDKDAVGWICKFLDFFGWGNCDLGILITAAMTYNRACAIMFPLRQATVTRRNANHVLAGLVVIVVFKDFHFFIGSYMVDQTRKERLCDVFPLSEAHKYFWIVLWPWIHLTYLLICFVTIFASNIFLVVSVWKSRQYSRTMTKRTTDMNTKNKTTKPLLNITPMLIGESVALTILTLPFSLQLFIIGHNSAIYHSTGMRLLFSITFYMQYTNKCITFFTYCVTGEKFRKTLKDMMFSCVKGKTKLREKQFLRTKCIAYMASSSTSLCSESSGITKSLSLLYGNSGVSNIAKDLNFNLATESTYL